MTVAERQSARAAVLQALRERILAILKASEGPVSVPRIEIQLQYEDITHEDRTPADTFDVRDAVADLIRDGQAEFVPGRLVQLVTK